MNNIGILDPDGKNLNPLNDKPYSDKYKELAKFWSTLPMYSRRIEIIDDIKQNQVILVISQTGSGKSLIMPKLVLHTCNYNGKIAMTLPKQIIAKSAAEFAALTLDVKLGQEIGYQYRGAPSNSKSDKTKILYATDGTIIARRMKDSFLKDFDCIIIDEAHEMGINIILLLYLLRETLKLRPEFKLIIMSATIDDKMFSNYFKEFKFKKIDIGGQRLFPIESHFLDKSYEYQETLNEGFKILINILETDDPSTNNSHDIIFFVTSSNDAFNLCKMLNNHINNEKKGDCKITCKGDIFCIEVFAGMDEKKQTLAQDKQLYKQNSNFIRKVVIATNVAESSLTIDGVKYVIDCGYELSATFDPINKARNLERQLISQAQAKQRMGRAGRTEPGIVYHLYTKSNFENDMPKYPKPDIKTSDITTECLRLLSNNNVKTLKNLISTLYSFIEQPDEENTKTAVNTLIQLGAIENDTITNIGKLLNDIPANNIFMANAILFGKIYNCSLEILKIASLVEACKGNYGDLYILPNNILQDKKDDKKMLSNLERKFYESRKKFIHKSGDFLSFLIIFDKFNEQYSKHKNNPDKVNNWCYDNFFKINVLIKSSKLYKKNKQQLNQLIKGQLDPNTVNIKYNKDIANLKINDKITACLLHGFRLNTAVRSNNSNYRTQFSKDLDIKINKNSFLMFSKLPDNIFYYEFFISMGKNELAIVSEIPKNLIKILS